MISDIDLQDWQPKDFPQPIQELTNLDVFSFIGNETEQFKFLGLSTLNEAICATVKEPLRHFLFPKQLKVIKWQLSKNL